MNTPNLLSPPLQKYLDYVTGLEKQNIPHTVEQSGTIYTVRTDFGDREFVLREFKFKHELNLVKKVKKYVIDNEIYKNFEVITEEEIKYFQINKVLIGKTIKSPLEIDLSSAYWETARKLKIISEEIYQEGLTVSKPTRLIALGALAKCVGIYSFKDKEYVDITLKDEDAANHLTRHLFFHVSKVIDQLMIACKKRVRGDFMFYWTDAIFFNNSKHIPILTNMIKEHGFEYKQVNNEFVVFREHDALVYSKEKGKPSKKYKDLLLRIFNYDVS